MSKHYKPFSDISTYQGRPTLSKAVTFKAKRFPITSCVYVISYIFYLTSLLFEIQLSSFNFQIGDVARATAHATALKLRKIPQKTKQMPDAHNYANVIFLSVNVYFLFQPIKTHI